MRVCYDKLWRLLKDNKMQKRDLASAAEARSLFCISGGVEFIYNDKAKSKPHCFDGCHDAALQNLPL